MKRILLLLTLFCALFSTVKATEVTIGDPTSTTYSYYFPIRTYYKYAFNQQIFTADEIGMAGTINSITLNIKGSATLTTPRVFDIYMAEVEDTVFASSSSWVGLSADNLVYSGTETFTDPTAQEITFALETPFAYSGQGSLVIAFNNTTGEYQGTSTDGVQTLVFGSSTDSKKTIYANRDGDLGPYDVTTPGVTGTLSGQRNVITLDITPGGGPTIQCDKPESLDFTGVTSTEATLNWAGGSGTYDVEYKTASVDEWTFAVKNTTLNAFDLSGLMPNTTYNVRVKSKCDGGVESGYKTGSFKTMIGIPYADELATQGDWKKYQGLLNGTTAALTTGGSWNFGSRNGVLGGNHAYMNLYGTSCKNWIVSPVIPLEENVQLSFSVALTDFNNANPVDNIGNQPDDRLVVLLSADSMLTWQILREWNNSGSEYVYDEIAPEGDDVEIDLSSYAGQNVQIAFYGESTVSNGDNDIHVGHVLIDYAPSCLKPTGLHEVEGTTSKNSVQVAWEHMGAQAFLIQCRKATEAEYGDSIVVSPNPEDGVYTYTITGLDVFTEYKIRVAAQCDLTDESTRTDYCKEITVKTAAGVPFAQDFNITALPNEWKRYDANWLLVQNGAPLEATNSGWNTIAKAQGNNVFDSAYHAMLNIAGTMNYWLVSPTIEMEAGYQMTFSLALTTNEGAAVTPGAQPNDKFAVLIFVDGNWAELGMWSNTGSGSSFDGISSDAAGQTVKFAMDAYAGKNVRLAFYGESSESTASNNIHIANLQIAERPACSPALSLGISDLDVTSATAAWTTDEPGSVWQYGLVISPADDFVPTDADFVHDTTALSVALDNLTAETTYAFFVRKACDNGYSDALVRIFTTYPNPKTIPWNENFEAYTANTIAPYWDNSASGSTTINGTNPHYIWGVYEYSGNKMIRMYNSLVQRGTAIINTPRIDLAPENGCMLSFDYSHAASCDPFSVRISIDNGKSWTELASYAKTAASTSATDPGEFTRAEINLAAYAGQVVVLQFYSVSNYGSGAIFVDNISIDVLPDCLKPTNLAVSNISANAATFSWDNEEGATWEYVCVPDTITDLPAYTPCAQNAVQLENLSEKTDYIFYLRRVCGESVSDSVFVTFSTPCAAVAIGDGAYTEGFEDYEGATYSATNGVVPDCWSVYATGSVKPHVIGSGSYYYKHEGTKALTFYGSGNCYAALPQFAEELNTLQIKFWMQTESASNGTLTLGYITDQDPGDFSTFVAIQTFANNNGSMVQREKILDEIDAEAYRLAFRWVYSSQYSCCIDDIEVSPIPTCLKPADLAVVDSLTTTTSATFTWTPGLDETYYLVQYKKSTDSIWSYVADTVHLADTTFTLTGLEPSSTYEVRFASWCNTIDSTDISEFTAPFSFNTNCDVITTFPYSENFDALAAGTSGATNLLPICWDYINTTTYSSYMGYPTAYKGTSYANTPDNSLKFYSYSASSTSSTNYDPQDQYAILPEMQGINGLRIKFNARKYGASYDATFTVGVMTNPADTATYVVIDTIRPASTTYESFVVPFSAASADARFIVIKMDGVTVGSSAAYRGVHIDDIVVEIIPNCLEPADLVAVDSLITMNSAVLTWTVQGDETEWVLQYKKHAAEEWTSIVATNNTVLLENLESATMYDARVAAKCGAEELSPFTAQISFVTTCGAYSIVESGAYTEGFEAYEGASYNATTGIIPNCWEASTTNSSNIAPHVIKPTDTYAYIHSGEKALTFYGSGYCYAVMPEFAEPLNTLQISFWAAMESASNGTLKLGYITEANPDVFHEIATYDRSAAKVMSQYETVLNAVPDSAARLVFEWYYSGQWSCCIDDIEVSLIPNCLKPTNLAVDSIAKHAALISWTAENEETAWAVQYKKSADSIWLDAPVANDTIYLLENLAAATSYDVQVAAICSESERSAYSAAISFITDCDARTEFPYVEGFDSIVGVTSGHVLPICWNYINTCTYSSYSYYPTVYKSTTYANTPDNALRFYSYGYSATYDPQDQYAILPEMENISSLNLKFNARKYSTSYAADFYVGVMTNPSDTATFVEIAYLNPTDATYEAFEVPFNHYEGNGQFIAIKMIAPTSSYRGFFIDDVVVEKLPACMQPENLEVSDITASSATIKWVNGTADQNAWQIVYSCDPQFNIADVTEAEIIDIASNPYALAELTMDTLYNVYVRANCGGEDGVSAWSTISFHTASACQTPTDLAAADITATSASISWNAYGQTGFNLRYSINGTLWLDTIYNITGAPYVLGELLANEDYYVQVQNDCNEEEWSESLHFKTTCVAWSIANDGDYVEDFDSYTGTAYNVAGVAPDCWEIGGTSTYVPHVVTGTSYAWTHSGINSFGFTGSANSYCYAVLPQFEEDLNRLQISLWTRMESTAYGTLSLGYITADEDMIYILKNYPSATSLVRHEDNLDTIPAEATRLVLLWQYTGTSYYSCTVDDIAVSFIPTCLKPSDVAASDIFGHSAKISWTPGEEGQNAWQIAYDTLPSKQPDTLANIIDVTENPYVLEGLLPSHIYYAYVRANCGEQDGLSKWSDAVNFTTTVACPAPTGLKATLTPGNGTIATLTWNAGDAQAWSVEYSLNANMSDSLVVIVSTPVADLTGLTPEATYYARVKADCGELDGESEYSAIISFVPTNKYEMLINSGTATNSYVPVEGNYVDEGTASQFVIPAASIEDLEWDTIKAMTFYSSSSNSNWGASEWEIYMIEVPETTLSALADWNDMTQVMTSGSLALVNGKMVVTLTDPYYYQGGNLLIGFKQTVTSGSSSLYSSASWYGVSASGASIGGHGTGYSMSQRNFLPKINFEYAPGVAPACPNPKNLVIDEITDNSAVASWKAFEGATWEYALVEGDAEPAAFIATTENEIDLEGLADGTAYTFYLRRACGVDGYSDLTLSARFTTEEHAEALPFAEDFEGENYFKFVQAEQTNAWVIGSAVSNGGDKALYISNDGGASNAYTTNVANASFATILIDFADRGSYAVSYDWKANGDYDDEGDLELYDYLRVALVPADAELVAGTPALPEDYIALDNGGLYGATTWQHMALSNVQIYDGLYKLVFAWFSDESDGEQAPAAIDNISIVRSGPMTDIEGGAGIETKAIKFMKNNQIYILVNGTVYSITGQKVEVK